MKRREFLGSAAGLTILLLVTSAVAPAEVMDHGDRPGPGPVKFVEEAANGTLTIMDAGVPVLTYRFGDQLKEGVDARFTRSTYIHPLFSLDGRELTADFPADHVHHHGLFWGWPVVKVRGQTTSNWEVGSPSLRQRFVRWLKRDVADGVAVLSVENTWRLGEAETVAREVVTIRVQPADPAGREIDLELSITAVGGPIDDPRDSRPEQGLRRALLPELSPAQGRQDDDRQG